MQKTQLFASVAEFYDYSMRNNCDYFAWAEYVANKIKTHLPTAKIGIDMACGSGFFTRYLKKGGYSVTGIDISPEMLTSAQSLTAKEGLFIPYFVGDMTAFKFNGKVDFITAINDAINCLPNDKLEKAFKCMGACLKKGGLLHFDISSEYKLTQIIANNTFCEDDEDYSYIWFNTPHEDKVVMEMSVFLRKGNTYEKRESILTEYIHKKERIEEALKNSGFSLVSVNGDMGEYTPTSHRINFTAKKD